MIAFAARGTDVTDDERTGHRARRRRSPMPDTAQPLGGCHVQQEAGGNLAVDRPSFTDRGRTMRTALSHGRIVRFVTVAALATCIGLGATGTATAQSPDCAGRGVPTNKISIQLWTFAEYVGFGTDAATIARLETVLSSLSEMGYRNVEPFTLSGLSAEDYRALLDCQCS